MHFSIEISFISGREEKRNKERSNTVEHLNAADEGPNV